MKGLIKSHLAKTNSPHAQAVLADWEHNLPRLLRVIPKDRHTMELEEAKHESAIEIGAN